LSSPIEFDAIVLDCASPVYHPTLSCRSPDPRGHASPAQAGMPRRQARRRARFRAERSRRQAESCVAPPTNSRRQVCSRAAPRRAPGGGALAGAVGPAAYWPRLASCVLRGGSARSRSMRSTSA
jgi:hypothetical protein